MREILLPRYPDGTGWTWLQCTEEADRLFRFSEIAPKYPELRPLLNAHNHRAPGDRIGDGPDAYRIALPEKWPSGGWAKVRFTLSKRTPKKTLEVIGLHLNEERIPWLFFTDAAGTRLKRIHVTPHQMCSAA